MQRLQSIRSPVVPAALHPARIATLRSFCKMSGAPSRTVSPGIYEDNVLAAFQVMTPHPTGETFVIVAAQRDHRCLVRLDAKTGFSSIDGMASAAVLRKLDETEPGRDFFMHTLRVRVLTPAEVRNAVCKMPVWFMRAPGAQASEPRAQVPLGARMLKQSFFADYSEIDGAEPDEPADNPYRRM